MNYLRKLTCQRPRLSSADVQRDLVTETESNRGRIIQSAAIRRLQQKTQVYPLESNAAVRSRLTHSLEVQQTGRFLALTILDRWKQSGVLKTLGLEGQELAFTNLVEMACLLHDVGNPPFGHFGEAAISRWMEDHAEQCHDQSMQRTSGKDTLFQTTLLPDLCVFEGNAQGLRIIHHLQNLNLTYSQMAALIKYTRPPYEPAPTRGEPCFYRKKKPGFYYSEATLVRQMQQHLHINEGCRFPLVYIMEAADDIAYCIADLEDALDKGILSLKELQFWLNQVWSEFTTGNAYLPDIMQSAAHRAGTNEHEFIVRLRTRLVRDLVDYAANRYINKHDEVFAGSLDEPLIEGGSNQHLALQTLKTVAVRHVFTSMEKETPELRGYAALIGLLDKFKPLLTLQPDQFQRIVAQDDHQHFIEQRLYHRLSRKHKAAYCRAVETLATQNLSAIDYQDLEWYYRTRLLIDYVSGMTDHFVVDEFQSLSAI
ncbi:dGTPase [Endozoicomonas euniceicola]|uniref:DGTPase n=1 Tax=Endozoicomonas euniceicola TaxID=1234143 RepID=A0ABY6GRJ9_9GAMM|nr:dGTPase [Endozoicomonas euniceicola]UYM15330.1 dGTPase [Endozoicomonas euniceicola]